MFDNLKNSLGHAMTKVGLADEVPSDTPNPAAATPATVPVGALTPGVNFPTTASAPSADAERIAKYDAIVKSTLLEVVQKVEVKLIPELQTLLTTLEAAIPVEPMRFQTALKIFTARGTPISAIVSEYDLYEGALQEKNQVFGKEAKDQYDARVGAKIKAVADFDAAIAAKQAQIAALQQELVDLAAKRAAEQGGISEADSKLKLLQSRFTVAYNDTLASVQAQKTKVVEYGKGL